MSSRDSLDREFEVLTIDEDGTVVLTRGLLNDNSKQAIHQWALDEVIGADEPMLDWDDPKYDHEEAVDKETRNEFRAEQRKRLKGDIDE